jgi:hypothetical protein
MLHVTNGEATKRPLEASGVPGRFVSWDDILHEGPTPLVSGDEWLRVRAEYLVSVGYGDDADDMARQFKVKDDALETLDGEDEVVFWFEHDLYDQLLLVRHLWWIGARVGARGASGASGATGAGASRAKGAARYSMVIGDEYLGLMQPADFPPRFARRREITAAQIALGTDVWTTYCGDDPSRLVRFAMVDLPPEGGSHLTLPYLRRAMFRLLEEFPSLENGVSRSERQILEILAEGDRTPEQAFMQASKLEEDIWMGDWPFWTIVKGLNAGTHPLLTLDVQPREERLPTGTIAITETGRRVLARRADHIALNSPSRWIGGTWLTPERSWRWTGSSLLPPSP